MLYWLTKSIRKIYIILRIEGILFLYAFCSDSQILHLCDRQHPELPVWDSSMWTRRRRVKCERTQRYWAGLPQSSLLQKHPSFPMSDWESYICFDCVRRTMSPYPSTLLVKINAYSREEKYCPWFHIPSNAIIFFSFQGLFLSVSFLFSY